MKKILQFTDSILQQRSVTQINLISLAFVVLISLIDTKVGYEIAVSIFFLIPIAISTWYAGKFSGACFCIMAAVIWFFVDNVLSAHPYINPIAPYWNTIVRLGFFLITSNLLHQLHQHLIIESKLSRTDSLTQLLNRRGFTEQVEQLFGIAARHSRPVVIAYIDLDNFKKINDELGHSEGDKVLHVVGAIIANSLRTTDIAGRMGGDEFAIVLPETDEAGAKSVFDLLRNNLLEAAQKHHWPIGLSIGVVAFSAPSSSLDEAIKIADSLMFQVKSSGKNGMLFQRYPITPNNSDDINA